jgi:hypothetical protein
VTYTPNPAFTGTDTFYYTISDGRGGTNTGTVTVSVTDFTVTGLRVWYKADGVAGTDNSPIAQWPDMTGNAFHATQANPAHQPVLVANSLNGKPVVRFVEDISTTPDIYQWLDTPYTEQLGDFTAIAVFKDNGVANFAERLLDKKYDEGFTLQRYSAEANSWTCGVLNTYPTGSPTNGVNLSDTAAHLLYGSRNGTTLTVIGDGKDGTADKRTCPVTTALMSSYAMKIGRDHRDWVEDWLFNAYLNADIAELLVYNRALSDAERQQIEISLSRKYNLGINHLPVANADSTSTGMNVAKSAIPVLANDTDVDNDTLSVSAVTQGAHGTVSIGAGNTTVTYAPNTNWSGTDTFTYTANDGHGGTAVGTVTVDVIGVPTTGLLLWLKADALALNNNDPVNTWTDSSGNGRHAVYTHPYSEVAPVFVTNGFNGKPVVRFTEVVLFVLV